MNNIMFTREEELKFEKVWIRENVKHDYSFIKCLSDDEYINYYIWEDINWETMKEKHLPNAMMIRGNNNYIIFHGGCLGCKSQSIHPIDRCKGCMYFRSDKRDKENLRID